MNPPTSHPRGRFILLGLAIGTLIGVTWWTAFVIASGPSKSVIRRGGQVVEQSESVGSLLAYAPVACIPWTVIGLIVGFVSSFYRGYLVPLSAGVGMIWGGVDVLATNPFDGWLAWTMPVGCSEGALIGLVAGSLVAWAFGLHHGKPDDIDKEED